MITLIAPLLVDSPHAVMGTLATTHTTIVAAPIWDIGRDFKAHAVEFAMYLMIGGTALMAGHHYFIAKDKTHAIKTLVIGLVIAGAIGALGPLANIARDTWNGFAGGSSSGPRW